MKLEYISKIKKTFNGDENQESITNKILGGDSKEFDTPDNYNTTTDLSNDFKVDSVQTFVYNLKQNNTFNVDLLSLVNVSDKKKISFVNISCLDESDEIPIRFNVSIKVVTLFELGKMSTFTLGNLKNGNVEQLFVNNIIVANEKKAKIIITIGYEL